ncbi:MAG: hypothetical protein VKK97_04455 [Synechococcaceae cyanobacterium]|nr:hypothetical protein [Synechococcaceae cyanobacterium]
MSPTEMLPAASSLTSSGSLNDSASQSSGASAATSSEVEPLLQWIQHHPHYRNLSAAPAAKPSRRQRALSWLKQHVLANPAELHGTAFVTPATQRDSVNVARVVTTSNLVDGVGNFSLLLFAGGVASPLGWVSATALTAILLKFDQALFTAVARGGRRGRRMAYAAAVCGLLPFALLKTLGTGVGVEVMQNQSALQLRHATALVNDSLQQERARISRIAQADPTYATVRGQCLAGKGQLGRLSHSDPRWQSLQVELFGEWSQRNRDWRQSARSTPPPVCVQQKLIEADLRSRTDQARQQLNGIEQQRIALGNDQRFLKLRHPDRYSLAFQPNGEFRSTVELVAVGLDSFVEKLRSGQMSQLGLSLYVLLVSALTSFSACLLVLMHPHRPGVAQSWNEDLRRERDRWLAEQLQSLSASRVRDGGLG